MRPPMTDAEPTLGEVIRRLDSVMVQLTELTRRLTDDRREYDKIFLRRETYEAKHGSLVRRVDTLESDASEKEKADADSRRQLLFLILGAFLAAGLSLVVALILASGGAPT